MARSNPRAADLRERLAAMNAETARLEDRLRGLVLAGGDTAALRETIAEQKARTAELNQTLADICAKRAEQARIRAREDAAELAGQIIAAWNARRAALEPPPQPPQKGI